MFKRLFIVLTIPIWGIVFMLITILLFTIDIIINSSKYIKDGNTNWETSLLDLFINRTF